MKSHIYAYGVAAIFASLLSAGCSPSAEAQVRVTLAVQAQPAATVMAAVTLPAVVTASQTPAQTATAQPSATAQATATPTNLFGVQPGVNQTQIFAASDVPVQVVNRVKEVLAAAVKEWGSSGSLQFWLVGTNESAAKELSKKFDAQPCKSNQRILELQAIGAKVISTGKAQVDASWSGAPQCGIHILFSSHLIDLDPTFPSPPGDATRMLMHEYWHSVQLSYIQTNNDRLRQELEGPVWFVEGSAEGMASMASRKLLGSGAISPYPLTLGKYPFSTLAQAMTQKMEEVQSARKICPQMKDAVHGSSCTQSMAYSAGAWAVSYLINKSGENVLLEKFHPNVEKLGWDGAFLAAFNMTPAAFYSDFEKFLDLPIAEQVKILPTY